jgi:hypothetical protein
MKRGDVEPRLGQPLEISASDRGYLAAYEYDQGWVPPSEKEPKKKLLAPVILFEEVITAGMLSVMIESQGECQKGWLWILYDATWRVTGATECPRRHGTRDCSVSQDRRPSTLPEIFSANGSIAVDCDSGMGLADERRRDSLVVQADRGDSTAMYRLSQMTEARDKLMWLCRAADHGNLNARHDLGMYYEDGREGLKKDLVRAYVWYRLSATDSNTANLSVRRIRGKLSSDQLADAQRMYREWKPGQCEQDLDN